MQRASARQFPCRENGNADPPQGLNANHQPRLLDVDQQSRLALKTRGPGATATAAPIARASANTSSRAYITWTVVLIALMVGKVADWVPGLMSVPLVKVAFLFAAISAYRSRHALPPVRFRSSKITRAALAFLLLAIASFVFSIYKSQTLALSLYILILLLSIILVLKVTQNLKDVEKLLWGLVAAGVSLSIGLVLNYHGGRAFINGKFDPNDIAYALDTILPIVLALRSRPSRSGRLLMNALTFITVVSILLTGSRGGAIGLCAVMATVIAFPLSRDKTGALKNFSIRRTLAWCGILVLTVALAWRYLPTDTQQRMATLVNLGSDYNADPTENGSRLLIWRQDLGMVWKRPIGYGLGSAELVNGLAGGQYKAAHNSFVEALVEMGALGLVFYVLVLSAMWSALGQVTRIARHPSADEEEQKAALYARALRTALVGNVAAGLFLSQAYSAGLWMLVATAATLVRVRTARANGSVGLKPGEPHAVIARERS
jgi:O-antigen ligase